MRETRLSGSVEGVVSNHGSYSDSPARPQFPNQPKSTGSAGAPPLIQSARLFVLRSCGGESVAPKGCQIIGDSDRESLRIGSPAEKDLPPLVFVVRPKIAIDAILESETWRIDGTGIVRIGSYRAGINAAEVHEKFAIRAEVSIMNPSLDGTAAQCILLEVRRLACTLI
jgi:hypothetical protein